MRVSAHVERCPTCNQPLPSQPDEYVEDPPSRLVVWIVAAMLIFAAAVAIGVWAVIAG